MKILKAFQMCLDSSTDVRGFILDGGVLARLMRQHKVSIRELSKRSGITQTRIREVRGSGLDDRGAVRDWVQHVTGSDPGVISTFYYG